MTRLDNLSAMKLIFENLNFMRYKKQELMPLYRGTLSNFSYDEFIKACYNIAPTICIATYGSHVLGGFTNIPWSSDGS